MIEVFLEYPFASRLFFSERRSATVTSDESPIIDTHTRKPIGVVTGWHMGLFRNTVPSLILIVPIRNINSVTAVLHEAA